MPKSSPIPEVDPAALSQDHEYRLRSLEAAAMTLLGITAMTINKVKADKNEWLADLEVSGTEIAFTIANYAVETD